MKTTLSLVLFLVSMTAQAAPAVLLQYTTENGSVNPMYGTRIDCEVLDNGKVTLRKITGDIAKSATKDIKWSSIRNETVLKSLIADAKLGQLVYPHTFYPIGAPSFNYQAFAGKTEVTLLQKIGSAARVFNSAESASRLIDFLDVNCK